MEQQMQLKVQFVFGFLKIDKIETYFWMKLRNKEVRKTVIF